MKKSIIVSLLFSYTFLDVASSDGDRKRDQNVPVQRKKLTLEEEARIVDSLIRQDVPYDEFVKIINENNIDVNIEPAEVFSQLLDEPTQDIGTLLRKYATGYLGYEPHMRPAEEHEIEQQLIPFIKFLLSKGANPNLVSLGATPLEGALNANIAKLLLDYGANLNISSDPKLKNALNYFKFKQAEVAKAYKNSPHSAWADSRMSDYQQLINFLEPLTIPQPIEDKEIADLVATYAVPTAPRAPGGAQEILELEQKARATSIPQAPPLTAQEEQAIVTASQQADQKQTAQWTSNHALAASFIQSNFPKKAADLIGREKLNPFAKNDKGQTLYDIALAAKKTGKKADWNELMELMKKLSAP